MDLRESRKVPVLLPSDTSEELLVRREEGWPLDEKS